MVAVMSILRLDQDLKAEEEAHHIQCRWPQSSSQYEEVQSSLSKQREKELGEIMWSTFSRRRFLLKLKAKYAGTFLFDNKIPFFLDKNAHPVFHPDFLARGGAKWSFRKIRGGELSPG